MKSIFRSACRIAMAALFFCAAACSAGEGIPVKDLPEPVVAAIQKQFPNAELLAAEKKSRGEFVYEVKIKDSDTTRKVHLSADGLVSHVETDN